MSVGALRVCCARCSCARWLMQRLCCWDRGGADKWHDSVHITQNVWGGDERTSRAAEGSLFKWKEDAGLIHRKRLSLLLLDMWRSTWNWTVILWSRVQLHWRRFPSISVASDRRNLRWQGIVPFFHLPLQITLFCVLKWESQSLNGCCAGCCSVAWAWRQKNVEKIVPSWKEIEFSFWSPNAFQDCFGHAMFMLYEVLNMKSWTACAQQHRKLDLSLSTCFSNCFAMKSLASWETCFWRGRKFGRQMWHALRGNPSGMTDWFFIWSWYLEWLFSLSDVSFHLNRPSPSCKWCTGSCKPLQFGPQTRLYCFVYLHVLLCKIRLRSDCGRNISFVRTDCKCAHKHNDSCRDQLRQRWKELCWKFSKISRI